MCVRITIPELGVDELVCNHREALDLARKLVMKELGRRARSSATTYYEAAAKMQEYSALIYTLERIAKNKAGLAVSPWR